MLRNNIAAGSGRDIINFDGGTDDFNTWTLPVTVSSEDFQSLDHAEVYAPRLADGSLPPLKLARLREDSDLIDRGEDAAVAVWPLHRVKVASARCYWLQRPWPCGCAAEASLDAGSAWRRTHPAPSTLASGRE